MDASPRWSPTSSQTIYNFLKDNKPTQTIDNGLKPWIWVRKGGQELKSEDDAQVEKAVEEGSEVFTAAEDRCVEIAEDDSIPTRASKGKKSKKACRDEIAAQVKNDMHEIATKYDFKVGKFLVFRPPETIDDVFAVLARSLVQGPLKETPLRLMKVSTTKPHAAPVADNNHVICLYFDDVFDKETASSILRILAKEHGLGKGLTCKADLYTLIGIDSKNKAGLRSSIWTQGELIPNEELSVLLDEFHKVGAAPKRKPGGKAEFDADSEDEGSVTESEDEALRPKKQKKTTA